MFFEDFFIYILKSLYLNVILKNNYNRICNECECYKIFQLCRRIIYFFNFFVYEYFNEIRYVNFLYENMVLFYYNINVKRVINNILK